MLEPPSSLSLGHVSVHVDFVSRSSCVEKKPNAPMWVVLQGFQKPAVCSNMILRVFYENRKLQSLGKGFTTHGFLFSQLPSEGQLKWRFTHSRFIGKGVSRNTWERVRPLQEKLSCDAVATEALVNAMGALELGCPSEWTE